MYAIIDVETTGTSAAFGKITDIAIYIHNGKEITDSFSTLINPECIIPAHITRLTGISNEMVADAPRFYEVAKKIIEMTAGRIFVAHNASFDYSFIKQEFKRLGYDYRRKLICTVKMGRKLMPGYPSYSLGNICDRLGIRIENRHRAAGDALATTCFFEMLLKQNQQSDKDLFNQSYSLTNEKIDAIPETPGVYYFYDEKGTIIYIGKSKDIHQRVLSHLGNSRTKKAIEMRDKIADVSWEETGSELIALLLESSEIKKHKPLFNRLQRRSASNFGLFLFEDSNGYLNLEIKRIDENGEIRKDPDEFRTLLTTFHFQTEAMDYLHDLSEKNNLCKKLCHLDDARSDCFGRQLHSCKGACSGDEDACFYNLRVKKAVSFFQYESPDFFIVDKGRSAKEYAVVKIEKGKYTGFGFINEDSGVNDVSALHDYITPYKDNRDVQGIIKSYLKRKKGLKIIEFRKEFI